MSGHAVFGPYASLQPGKYRIEFSIKPLDAAEDDRDALIGIADVTAGVVNTLFDTLVFRSQLKDEERYVAYFETDRPLSEVEYRFYVNGVEPLLIGDPSPAVEIEGSEPLPQASLPPAFIREHSDRVRTLFYSGAAVVARGGDLVVTRAARSFLVRTPQDLTALESYRPETPTEGGDAATLIIALGVPAPFGKAGWALVGHVMNAVYGGHRRVHCETLAELRAYWSEHRGRSVLLTSDRPDTALSYLLTTSDFPIFAFVDDLADAVIYRAAIENQPIPDAIRLLSRSCSCLIGCTASENVHIFDSRHYGRRVSEIVEDILAALGIASDSELVAHAVQHVCAAEGLSAEATVQQLVRGHAGGEDMLNLATRRFDIAARALINAFAVDYGPFLQGRENDVEWPLELFYVGANGKSGDHYVELIGGARHIVYGPYLHLPFGGWRALVQFEVADNVSGNEIEVDVWVPSAQISLAKSRANLPAQGFFQFTLDFVNTDPGAVLELRVRLVRSAIEGRFVARRVTMHPVGGLEDIVGAGGKQPKSSAAPPKLSGEQ